MKKLRHLLEYAGLRFALFMLDRLSARTVERMAIMLADAWYTLNGSRRTIARENILRSGITHDPAEANRIARDSFRHFAVLVIESLKSQNVFTESNWQGRVNMDVNPQALALLKEPGRSLILASGHFGNWEIAAQLISFIKPVTGITRDMNNPYTDQLMKQRKPRNNFRLTPKHAAGIDRLLSVLKNGEILAVLIDQHAKDRGMQVEFFGTPASTHTSPALLHLITKAPICFGYCIRTGPMTYTLKATAPIIHKPTGNRQHDVMTILEKLNSALEDAIRQHPEQYLWAHRRWKPAKAKEDRRENSGDRSQNSEVRRQNEDIGNKI